MITKIIGFGFIVFGVLWSIFERVMCKSLCSVCTSQQLSPCFFLFLFVGIIFVVTGYSLAIMKQNNLPRARLKINKKQ